MFSGQLRHLKAGFGLLTASLLWATASSAITPEEYPALGELINELVAEQHFERDHLLTLFQQVELRPEINEAMSRPAEKALEWGAYKALFVTASRTSQGVTFWQQNAATLARAEQHFGVPAAIIVAIIGVETRYGAHTGRHPVLVSLSTLAFTGARRRAFFTKELRAFLLLTREENKAPLEVQGSYAGASGIPQFIPTSYRHYAVDFDGDQIRDLWTSPADAIGSVANYFQKHHWQPGEPVLHLATATADADKTLLDKGLKPHTTLSVFRAAGYDLEAADPAALATLIQLRTSAGPIHYAGRQNFYVITRYNRSTFYAMAVYELSQAIEQARTAALQKP